MSQQSKVKHVIAREAPPPSPSPAGRGGKGWGEIALLAFVPRHSSQPQRTLLAMTHCRHGAEVKA